MDELKKALKNKSLIRVFRDQIDGDEIYSDGYVVDLSNDWVLLHFLDERIVFDGYCLLRLCDISKISQVDNFKFIERAIELKGLKKAQKVELKNSILSFSYFLEEISRLHGLVALSEEISDPNSSYVGKIGKIELDKVELRNISTTGEWLNTEIFDTSNITRVDFGGEYLNALNLVINNSPASSSGTEE